VKYPQSAYLHIPFCHRRCFYCDFPVVPLGDKANGENGPGSSSINSYLKLLHKEIKLAPKGISLSTIYIGGGTPSLLSPNQISKLLNVLRDHFGFKYGAEITLEIDPASFDEVSLEGFLDAGINRLSLGAQSFDDCVLKKLGRRHTFKDLSDACYLIGASFSKGKLLSWSLDLIQNLPGQELISWKDQIERAVSFNPPHLSIYDLSIEKGTVFEKRQRRGELFLPNDEVSADISKMTSKMLKSAGFSRYEISNYALPGHASRHNRVYWSASDWWGFGQGATSCLSGKRLSRPRTRETYKNWIESVESKGYDQFFKSFDQKPSFSFDDMIIVGLRRREGIDLKELLKSLGWNDIRIDQNLNELRFKLKDQFDIGLIKQIGYRFYLTDPDGMDLSNQIIVEILLWWESLNDFSVA